MRNLKYEMMSTCVMRAIKTVYGLIKNRNFYFARGINNLR